MIFTSSLVFALCLIQPFLSAALSFVDYDACTKAQTDATDHYIMCIYEQKSVAECQSTFMYDWKELSSGVCPKTQPASQSILNLVGICLGEKFTQEKCIKLSGYFIECAHEEDEPIKGCPYDLKICPDGSTVIRDPDNNCDFFACEVQGCYSDAKECPDGSFVSRDPDNNCDFSDCPDVACTADVQKCPDGSYVSRDPENNCDFKPCCCSSAEPHCYTGKAACCSNGKWSCPTDGWYWCEDEWTWQGPFGEQCEVPSCPYEKKQCSDGSFVIRNPDNSCEFFDCPNEICSLEVKECPDGSFVSRDPENNCNFESCCCSPAEPYCYTGKAACCSNGRWSCPSKGWYWCEDEWTWQGPFGEQCEVPACALDVKTCPNGAEVSRNPYDDCNFFQCPDWW